MSRHVVGEKKAFSEETEVTCGSERLEDAAHSRQIQWEKERVNLHIRKLFCLFA